MLIKRDEQKVSPAHGLAGGKGDAVIRTLLPAEESADSGRLFAIITLEPGSSVGYHKHQNEYEVYYMLEGTGVVTEDGREYELETGDMHQCKSGSSHGIENRTSSPLKFLALIIFNGRAPVA